MWFELNKFQIKEKITPNYTERNETLNKSFGP